MQLFPVIILDYSDILKVKVLQVFCPTKNEAEIIVNLIASPCIVANILPEQYVFGYYLETSNQFEKLGLELPFEAWFFKP